MVVETLLHFSEDPGIRVFAPHVPASAPHNPPMVWAVDEEHAPGFWFPPRATCWSIGKPLTAIGASLLGMGSGTRMHAIETAWLARLRTCRLYAYRFDAAPFRIYDAAAGYYAATRTVEPLSVEPAGDLLDLHARAEIELRVVPNLWPLIDAIVASGLEFSIIRKLNAKPRDASTSAA